MASVNEFGGEDFEDEIDPVATEDLDNDAEELDTDVDDADEDSDDADAADAGADGEGEEDDAGDDGDTDDADEEDEDEDDSDDADDEDEPADKKADKKLDNNQVPRARLNKESERRKAAEKELSELKAAMGREAPPAPKEFGVDSVVSVDDYKAMQTAMLDEDTEKGFALFSEMLRKQSLAASEATREAVRGELDSHANSRDGYREMVKEAERFAAMYPELDDSSADANPTMIDDVVSLRELYISKGLSPTMALGRAVRLVASDNELADRTAKREPKVQTQDIKKKMVTAAKEKGKLPGASTRVSKKEIDVSRMSERQFNQLSKEALRRARGDYL